MRFVRLSAIILFVIAVYFLSNVLSGLLMGFYYAVLAEETSSMAQINLYITENILLSMTIASIIGIIIYLVYLSVRGDRPGEFLEFNPTNVPIVVMSLVLGAGVALFLNSIFAAIEIERFFGEEMEMLQDVIDRGGLGIRFLSVGIVIPIFEEVMYRGMIFNDLKRNLNMNLAILIQAIIFGILHANLYQFVYVVPAGILLALVYQWTATLLAPILIHISWNSMSLVMNEYFPGEILAFVNYGLIVVGFLLILVSTTFIKNQPRRNKYIF
ncbi:CPBP family intramembrane glutamic endopeptidase [Natranaerobius thermophilus]|uniref:Abortive infection protein n=1 Tax=Natranaerobius thermophilus (strain ATCC BAA-1301 / DSM 18059 / JW/NM-WN-LF) TaxID=457570 RepID=B2A6P2_NATTJ|nr:CPBP family intramembrane glutamic endopeptidase [Natranaerobius thermophilus]ACB84175.1 Abortive infection protein [Natranaerobius thermophilus JW/NM-WN-LF]